MLNEESLCEYDPKVEDIEDKLAMLPFRAVSHVMILSFVDDI